LRTAVGGKCPDVRGIRFSLAHPLNEYGKGSPTGGHRIWIFRYRKLAKELLGHEHIKTIMLYAKADTRLIRDAIRSFDALERSGYKRWGWKSETSEEELDECN